MEKEKLIRILDKADEFVGATRSMLDDYQEQAKKIRAELYKVFEETRKIRKSIEGVIDGVPCRKCGSLFDKDDLDINQFCKRCEK